MKTTIIVLIFTIITSMLPAAAAEPSSSLQIPANWSAGMLAAPRQRKPRRDLPHGMLVQPVQLPAVPRYTGTTKYLNGYQVQAGDHCQIIGMNVCTKEDQKTVLEWYRLALAGSGWTVKEPLPNTNICQASLGDGTVLQITTTEGIEPGYKATCHYWYRRR